MNTIDDKDKVINRIMGDIADYAKQMADAKKFTLDGVQDPIDLILTYIRTKNKTFANKKRSVVISQELKDKISTLRFLDNDGNIVEEEDAKYISDLIYRFAENFRTGVDVTNHSSKGIFSTNEDYILNNWKLRHLHLSDVETAIDKSDMSRNRSSWLLFYILEDEVVDFVDVLFHPKGAGFTAFKFLEIIEHNGWMEKIGFKKNTIIEPGTLRPSITKNEDIYFLYKNHFNVILEVNGKVFSNLGVTSAGYDFESTFGINKFRKDLRKILDETQYVGLKVDNDADGVFELVFKDKEGNGTKIECCL